MNIKTLALALAVSLMALSHPVMAETLDQVQQTYSNEIGGWTNTRTGNNDTFSRTESGTRTEKTSVTTSSEVSTSDTSDQTVSNAFCGSRILSVNVNADCTPQSINGSGGGGSYTVTQTVAGPDKTINTLTTYTKTVGITYNGPNDYTASVTPGETITVDTP